SLWFKYCSDPKSYNYNVISITDVDKTKSIQEIIFATNNLIARHTLLR
ncbi:40803_t:CDS:1, partial [Gigaspora margarita]